MTPKVISFLAVPVLETVRLPPVLMVFQAGRDVGADEKCPDGEPLREVNLPHPCAMGKTDVTFWQYDYHVWARRSQGEQGVAYPGAGRATRYSSCRSHPAKRR